MKIDARDWIFQVSDGASTPVWLEIAGVNTFELDPNANGETTETTDFLSGGNYEGQAMQRGASLELEGFRVVDEDDADDVDPGQARVDALGAAVSEASLGALRFRHQAQSAWVIWQRAYVEPGGQGGGNNDKTSWAATFTRSGAATTAAVA